MSAGCSKSAAGFPDTITFAGRPLTKGSNWTRGGMSAIVYVPPGEKMPDASLQVGVLLSTEHTTAQALHNWILDQSMRAGGPPVFSSGEPGQVCKVAWQQLQDRARTYMALQVCKTGVARAACVEADEEIDQSEFNACIGSSNAGCQDICDRKWLERREPLDLLAADVLSRR